MVVEVVMVKVKEVELEEDMELVENMALGMEEEVEVVLVVEAGIVKEEHMGVDMAVVEELVVVKEGEG